MKTVDEIFGEMLVSFGARTGMEVDQGCDLAVRLYAAEWRGRDLLLF